MADEPILCFDGDDAGLRAAHRAVDLALPLIEPGKSLRFALLPEGQDPDDLIRSGGTEAMAGVIAAARPLVDMIWVRETESGVFDTPERRAALETRLPEMTARSAMKACASTIAATSASGCGGSSTSTSGRCGASGIRARAIPTGQQRAGAGRLSAMHRRQRGVRNRSARLLAGERYVAASATVASSPVHRGRRAAITLRARRSSCRW